SSSCRSRRAENYGGPAPGTTVSPLYGHRGVGGWTSVDSRLEAGDAGGGRGHSGVEAYAPRERRHVGVCAGSGVDRKPHERKRRCP
ncbi:MAG: hypothetical protein WBX26_00400, partial [Candidatus Cybelea sp.]